MILHLFFLHQEKVVFPLDAVAAEVLPKELEDMPPHQLEVPLPPGNPTAPAGKPHPRWIPDTSAVVCV